MKLLKLHVEAFGKLQSFEYRFGDGLNTLHQPNGWGKSTLAVFIKAMLYGLPASTKRLLDENERKKYIPWQGGAYGGSLEFETERGRFRVERFFGDKESADIFDLYDLDTNLPSTVYSERLGEDLFGIDADGFERSTYLSQRDIKGGKDNNTISAKLGNLLDDVDDIASFDSAMEALDKRRKFYVMTGGRGAIAELEQEILDKTADLERCRRIEDALRAQKEELAENTVALEACKKAESETRARLERAALVRERRALAEQKQRMLTELTALSDAQKQISEFFGGNPPTDAQLEEAQQCYEEIKRTQTRLDTIPVQSPNAEELIRLAELFAGGVPEEEYLLRLTAKNDELRRIDTEMTHLKKSDALDASRERFSAGVPSKAQIDRAFEALRQANDLPKLPQADTKRPKKRSTLPILLGCGGLLIGLALAALSLLPTLATHATLLLVLGAVLGASGLILLIASFSRRGGQPSPQAQHDEQLAEWHAKRQELLGTVKALLTTYQMPTDDLTRSLTELSLLAKQHTESLQRHEQARRELDTLITRHKELASYLSARLSAFLNVDTTASDFGADIHRLHDIIRRYRQLCAAEEKRVSERKSTQQILERLKSQLLLFLRRYDPSGTLRAGQCLSRIAEQLAESRRLDREIERRTAELRAFIAEKRLEDVTEQTSTDELDRLSADAEALQARTAALHRKHATLKGSIDRLALDADRIPDLEEQIAQIRERLAEAKANADTIKHTARFLEDAKTALSTRYLSGMQRSLEHYLETLSEVVPEAVMDASFTVQLREGGKTRALESFSRGWRDMIELCTRLSLIEALYEGDEKPFLLLDDPFVNLDDDRMGAAKALLERLAQDYQILYLVCHSERV